MDNRWRFLYCVVTELWGHVWDARPGTEPGESGGFGGRKTRRQKGARRETTEKK